MNRIIMQIMSLVILLSSSFFFTKIYLTKKIAEETASSFEVTVAANFNIENAEKAQLNLYRVGSLPWLTLAKKLAIQDAEIATTLANFYVENNNINDAILWLKQGVRLGNIEAHLSLAQLYFDQHEYQQAKTTLAVVEYHPEALMLLMRIAVINGDLDFIKAHQQRLSTTQQAQALYKQLQHYQIIPQTPLNYRNLTETYITHHIQKKCIASIQFFATNLKDLNYAEQLISSFTNSNLSTLFCFSPVQYVPLSKLDCQLIPDEIIRCDESLLATFSQAIEQRYLAFLLPHGGANVHQGILYLDRSDTVEVLTHELTHLIGFIDEYPLPKNHAKCLERNTESFSHNIATMPSIYQGKQLEVRKEILKQVSWAYLIADTTPVLQKTHNGWKVGTPDEFIDEVGLFNANTCKERPLFSYKPIHNRTSLEYFEIDFPNVYLDIVNNSKTAFLMPSFHKNIAQALLRKGEVERANIWSARIIK